MPFSRQQLAPRLQTVRHGSKAKERRQTEEGEQDGTRTGGRGPLRRSARAGQQRGYAPQWGVAEFERVVRRDARRGGDVRQVLQEIFQRDFTAEALGEEGRPGLLFRPVTAGQRQHDEQTGRTCAR